MFTFLCAPYVPSRGHGGTEEAGIPNAPLENEMPQEGAEAHPSEAGGGAVLTLGFQGVVTIAAPS